jgi:hypothetical protein
MIIMKKLTSLLIGCSLALAGAALAQQPVEQQSPSKGKHPPEKAHATQPQPGANAAKPQERPATQQGATHQHGTAHDAGAMKEQGAAHEHAATNEPGAGKGHKTPAHEESATAPKTNDSADTSTPSARQQRIEERRKGMKGEAAVPKTSTNPAAPAAAAAGAGAASSVPAAGQQNAQVKAGAKGKKPDPQQVQQVKSQHTSFRAQPKPQQVQAVTFNQNHRIEGSDRWQGQHYEVFRSYHPEWHDQGWYHSHYQRVELIGGGYYFFNAGYWFPAWGYSPSAQYYAYDAPIYVGQRAVPPDQVIADVQALLQQMGYYTGEVDGLLGPLTREALTAYQTDQGLTATAVIDQPTLDSLDLA